VKNTNEPKRVIGLFSLILSGIICIIGSGWLFGIGAAAKMAGPAAIFSWIICGIAVMIIALTIAELGAMFPKSGGMVHYMYESHGDMAGFFSAWINFLGIAPVIATEALASIQYLSSWHFPWTKGLFNNATGDLTTSGLFATSLLLLVYFLLNYWSFKFFIKFMSFVTCLKIFTPLFTIISLIVVAFHDRNFTVVNNTIAPYGWDAVLTAIPACGIIYSFNGFQTPVNLAGEVKNPGRNIPIALICSIAFCLIIYTGLHVAFIGALSPSELIKGWNGISMGSPFAQLAITLNLNVLLLFIYLDVFVSPSGVGLTYFTTTSRMLYGMSHNNQMPKYLGKLNPKYGIPRGALWTVLIICFIFLFFFRGWQQFAAVLSVAETITYISGPIALMALRKSRPNAERLFRLPFANFICAVAFIICGLFLHWGTWPLSGEVILLGLSGFIFYIYYQNKAGWNSLFQQFKSSLWLIMFLVVAAINSYLGSKEFGGIGFISAGWDNLVVCITSLLFYFWGINSYYRKDNNKIA